VINLALLKVTFLGTGTSQGIPVIGSNHPVCLSTNNKDKRLRVSVLVEWDDFIYLVDCGPDFRYQMLRARVNRIDGILFTHEHSDHVAGLDDIRPLCYMHGDMDIYAHKRVMQSLEKRFDYIFERENKYPGAPHVIPHIIKNEPFAVGNIDVMPISGMHDKVQVFGFRFGDFAYLTDMKTIEDNELEKLKGLKVLVVNALRHEPHISHYNLEEALTLVKYLKPERAYFTHISALLGFHDEVEKTLPENVFLAYDELQITI
jgi:phosphoribosyl 1,2-cyclic phosphate phosphodiesterase